MKLAPLLLIATIVACAPATAPDPIVAQWTEEVQFACKTNAESVPKELLGELIFKPDGTFTVTWHPFETYVDYRGTYKLEASKPNLELSAVSVNYLPKDADFAGGFSFDNQSRLILSDMWLGSGPSKLDIPACGHRFKKVK